MKVEISTKAYQELGSLKHGDVFETGENQYGIVTDLVDGDRVGVVMLDSGVCVYMHTTTKIAPRPQACLQVTEYL